MHTQGQLSINDHGTHTHMMNTLITLGTCNNQAAKEDMLHYPGQCHPGSKVFWLLGQRL